MTTLSAVARRRLGGTALALAAVTLFATACGSDAEPAQQAAGAGDYASCLRDNGVNLPPTNPPARPTARPSGMPTARPSGSAFPRGSNGPGGGPGGGGFFGSQAPDGVDQQTWEKAQQACASLRPTANPRGSGNPQGGGQRDSAYRNCLSERGVTVDGPLGQLSTTDPKVLAAASACVVLSPSPRAS